MTNTISNLASTVSPTVPEPPSVPDTASGDFERLLAPKPVSQADKPQGDPILQSDVPPAVAQAIRDVAGQEVAAAKIRFYVLPSWSDADRLAPALPQAAVEQLQMATQAGLAFSVGGVDYAAVSEVDVRRNADVLGVPYEDALSHFIAQEIVQAKFGAGQDGALSADGSRMSEVLGEAVAASVVPSDSFMPLGLALSWLPQDRSALPPGYEAFLSIAVQSLEATLLEVGVPAKDGVSPAQQLGQAYSDAAEAAGGQGSIRDIFTAALSDFTDDPEALLSQMITNYAAALRAAVK